MSRYMAVHAIAIVEDRALAKVLDRDGKLRATPVFYIQYADGEKPIRVATQVYYGEFTSVRHRVKDAVRRVFHTAMTSLPLPWSKVEAEV